MQHDVIGSSKQRDRVQRSTSRERQNHSENSQERLQRMRERNTRLLRPVADNVPSTSNTDHPMQALELDQPRDQSYPQPREAWHDRLHRYMNRPYHLLMRGLNSPCPYEYDMDGNLRWGWYLNVNGYPSKVMSGNVDVREEKSPELCRIEQHLGIRGEKEEWMDFSVDLLDRYSKIMIGQHYLYLADTISYSDTKQVSGEDRGKDEYKSIKNLVCDEWKKSKSGALIDIDLSEVRLDIWNEFCHNLLDKHANKYKTDSDNYIYLKDILQGQGSVLEHKKNDQVSPVERGSQKYKNLERLVHKKWKKWNKQNKEEWYEWNRKIKALKGRDLLKAQLERLNTFFTVLDKDEVVKKCTNDSESLRCIEDIKQCQISDLQCNYVSSKERGNAKYKEQKELARAEWKAWTKEKAGALLGRDLSEVQPERWEKFTDEVLSAYEDKHEKEREALEDKHEKELMFIKDILQGGVAFVKDEDRESALYKDSVLIIRHKLDNQVKKQNEGDKEIRLNK